MYIGKINKMEPKKSEEKIINYV